MRLLVSFLFGLFALSLNGLNAFSAELPIQAVQILSGDSVAQGGIVFATFKTHQALPANAKCYFSQKAYPLFRVNDSEYQALVGLNVDQKPGGYTLAVRTAPTAPPLSDPTVVEVLSKNYGRQNITVSGKTAGLKPIPGELDAIGALKTTITPIRYWEANRFVSPTVDCENSPFGVRRYHNGTYTGDYHKGVDLRSPAGRPVLATSGGVVKIATTKYRLHGGTVGIDHGQGISSVYIHLSQVLVKEGQRVEAGEIIGKVGSTGFATGPHLHWGLYVTGQPVDPNGWVPYHSCN